MADPPPSPLLPMDVDEEYLDLFTLENLTQVIHPEIFEDLSQILREQSQDSELLPPSPTSLTYSENILSPPTPFKDIAEPPHPIQNHDPRKRYLSLKSSPDHPEPDTKRPRLDPQAHSSRNPPADQQPQPHCSKYPPPTVPQQPSIQVPSTLVGAGSVNNSFRILNDESRHLKKYDTDARLVTIEFRPPNINEDLRNYLNQIFSDLLAFLPRENVNPWDRVGLTIYNSEKPDQRSIGISMRRADQLQVDVILQTIEKVVQSNDSFFLDGPTQVKFIHVRMENGGAHRVIDNISSFNDFCKRKLGIIVIDNNNDNLCLARALVVAMAHTEKDESRAKKRRFNLIRRCNRNLQITEAQKLCEEAGVNLDDGGGVEELRVFQNHLNNYSITVFTDRRGKEVMFEGPRSSDTEPRKHLDLIFGNNHYNVITSLTAVFSCKKYCRDCKYPYEHHHQHNCKFSCPSCTHSSICPTIHSETRTCTTCNRSFVSANCWQNHLVAKYDKGRTTCDVLKRCADCNKVYNTLKLSTQHVCGEEYCSVCQKYRPQAHLCFMKKARDKKAPEDRRFLYIFFDFECSQDTPSESTPNSFLHRPNFCIAQQACYRCVAKEDITVACALCGDRQHVFCGENTLEDFMKYMTQPRLEFRDVVFFAHNMKSYDGQFVLKYMTEKLNWTPEVIMNGNKIQVITYDRIKVLDSLNFFGAKLSSLPKMFDLGCHSKGYFPHFFNKASNWEYVGSLPEPRFYGENSMKSNERKDFMLWYNHQKETNNYFNFREEIEKYCIQDVNILRLACLKFRTLFLKENRIDPLLQCITIASACMLTYRKNFLKEDTIGVIPAGGYRLKDKQSAVALEWLRWLENSLNVRIQHAGNGPEKRVCNYKVDGFLEENGEKTVYEFQGCWYHGCPLCFKNRDTAIVNSPNETLGTRYERTKRKIDTLRQNGYKVVEMWECHYKLMKAQNTGLRAFLKDNAAVDTDPLDPRHAFFGGRTNCTKLYYEADVDAGEKIRYLDVCSLYPWACKYGEFPLGHPQILVGSECPQELNGINGIVKVTVLPPTDLYHPVLPLRVHNRLFFPLCRTCAEQLNEQDCNHSSVDRQLTGTWVSNELKLALQKGYTLVQIHEVWHYETTKFDGRDGGLFAQYINKFLKLKQEASGWPAWVQSEEDQERYISEFERREGIKLTKQSIIKNPGLRALAKTLLNSFWGKFGQRNNLSKTTFVRGKDELTNLLTDPNVAVNDITPINDDILLTNWNDVDESLNPSPMTSVVIAAYVTATARIKLYEYLDLLGERVLYFDTDSVIFVERPGEPTPPVGDFLEDLTDELLDYGPGSFIDIFVSGGPKNYAFRVRVKGGQETRFSCKVKGINLNHKNLQLVNFDVIKQMVTQGTPATVGLQGSKIACNRRMEVLTRQERKTYRICYMKRRRVEAFDTLPYGFQRDRTI